jgi:hypothetical protein
MQPLCSMQSRAARQIGLEAGRSPGNSHTRYEAYFVTRFHT